MYAKVDKYKMLSENEIRCSYLMYIYDRRILYIDIFRHNRKEACEGAGTSKKPMEASQFFYDYNDENVYLCI